MRAAPRWPPECAAAAGRHGCRGRACAEHALPGVALRQMIGWSSYLMSRMMVANWYNVHYYERYVNLEIRGRPQRGELPFGIVVARTQSIEQHSIDRTVIELLNLSRRFDGDYDGWETPIVTQ